MPFRVGCSGWSYPHWRDIFYPHGLRQAGWFDHYAGIFDTVEINNSFYRTPSEDNFRTWGERVPPSFVYAIKVNRAITQYYKLGTQALPLFDEFVRRAEMLGPRLGPLLLQLPPSLGPDLPRLGAFLERPAVSRHPLALEFRHSGWFRDDVYALMRRHSVALVISDLKELPVHQVATADWVYARFHGPSGGYSGSYSDEDLRRWAAFLRELRPDGYVYFNNDVGGAAPQDALRFRELISHR
jgi:uncharacterized protein YecE (DUF72 family)